MSITDIIKLFGPPGLYGIIAGVGLVTWVRPETTSGALFLVMFTAVVVAAGYGATKVLIRWARRRPDQPPPDDASPTDGPQS